MNHRQLLGNLTTAPLTAGVAILISAFGKSLDPAWRQFAIIAGPLLVAMSVVVWVYLFKTADRDHETGRFVDAGPIGFVANTVGHAIHAQASARSVASTHVRVIRAVPGNTETPEGDGDPLDGVWTKKTDTLDE